MVKKNNIFLWKEKKIVFASEEKVFRFQSSGSSFRCNLWGNKMSFGIWHSNKDNILILAQAKNSTEWQNTRHEMNRSHWDDGKIVCIYGELKQVCWGIVKVSAKPYLFSSFTKVWVFLNLEGEKEFQMSSRKSAAAGQSTQRLVQPSIGVRLFVTQSSSAWGRAGGTSDHFHPSERRHEERHKQKKGQFPGEDFLTHMVCAIGCTVWFLVPAGASSYFIPKSIWRQEEWLPKL